MHFFFSSRRRHTRSKRDWSSDVCSSDLDAVVAGDVCYNQVHMMTAWTDDAARQAWIANLDAIAALNPSIVVSGHKRVDAPDSPDTIEQSKQYLLDFSRVPPNRTPWKESSPRC